MSSAVASPTPAARRVRTFLGGQLFGSVALAALMVLIWEIVSGLTFVIPSPAATVEVLIQNLTNSAYLFDMQVTAQSVVLAFVIGTAIGGGLGLLLGLSEKLRLIFEPTLIMLNGIPKIVLYPVLLPIFSLSGSKVVMGVLFALFPVLINVSTGVQEIPKVYWKLAKSVQANAWQRLVHIIFPRSGGRC